MEEIMEMPKQCRSRRLEIEAPLARHLSSGVSWRAWSGSLLMLTATLCFGTSAATASCHDRPGTPNEVRAEAKSSTSIEFSWRNTTNKGMNKSGSIGHGDTPHQMYFDIYVRDGQQRDIKRDLTGTGPFKGLVYGIRSSQVFDQLISNTKYCFSIRARTEGGTQGCISELQSAWACTTTLKHGAPPVAQKPAPTPENMVISAAGKPGNIITVTGHGFTHNALVTIRVTDNALTSVWTGTTNNGQPIKADDRGSINVTFNGLCRQQGALYFSANDGRSVPATVDRTGTLWSNTVKIACT
jgi:hypothetical protein